MKKPHILLVDDHPLNRFMVETILQKWNYQITVASDGVEALQAIAKADYDLVLMDIRMPKLDGNETAQVLRNHFLLRIPIVAITSDSIYQEEKTAKGFDGFVTKPFEHRFMQELLAELIARPVLLDSHTDFSQLRVQTAGDLAFEDRMKAMFFDGLPDVIQRLDKAIQNSDSESIRWVVHTLRPSLRCMTSDLVFQQFTDFERNETPLDGYVALALRYHLRKLLEENSKK